MFSLSSSNSSRERSSRSFYLGIYDGVAQAARLASTARAAIGLAFIIFRPDNIIIKSNKTCILVPHSWGFGVLGFWIFRS